METEPLSVLNVEPICWYIAQLEVRDSSERNSLTSRCTSISLASPSINADKDSLFVSSVLLVTLFPQTTHNIGPSTNRFNAFLNHFPSPEYAASDRSNRAFHHLGNFLIAHPFKLPKGHRNL